MVFILVVSFSGFFISFVLQFVLLFCFISLYHGLLLFGSVSNHFGPSAFNKFGFGFGIHEVIIAATGRRDDRSDSCGDDCLVYKLYYKV